MYKPSPDSYLYSPSDLTLYQRSAFASWMARYVLDYPEQATDIPRDKDVMLALLAEKGNAHEDHYVEQLKQEYGAENVFIIAKALRKAEAADETLKAMQKGYQVICQAYLQRDNFAGSADFLFKKDGQSELGAYYYEAWDTKLSRSTQAYFIVQLCCYSWMLEQLQGVLPEEVVVVLGNQKEERIRIAPHYSYFLNLKQQFLFAQANFTGEIATRPDPAFFSDYGDWGTYAKQLMETSDSLALVANMRKTQITKLHEAGIQTMSELAHSDISAIKGMSPETYAKLKLQAELQLQSRGKAVPEYRVITSEKPIGLAALPSPNKLDVFFDIEGHPLLDGGLEYLWGVTYQDDTATQGKKYAFKDWWAHTTKQEKLAFEGFIDWVYARWQKQPNMHVYHYASYEITAIKKISSRELTREKEIDELLKAGVFIDLYKIVKSGLVIGEPKYSIKNVEHLYRGKRTTDVANGGESVVVYERWCEAGGSEQWETQANGYQAWLANPDQFDWTAWQTLKEIRDYNIDDCESTLELYQWLYQLQQRSNISYIQEKDNTVVEKTEQQLKYAEKRQDLIERQQTLLVRYESNDTLKKDTLALLLIALLHFYEREKKPQAWAYYDRLNKDDAELVEEDTVVANVTVTNGVLEGKYYLCHAIYDLEQTIRTDKIKSAKIHGTEVYVSKVSFIESASEHGELSFCIKVEDVDALDACPLHLFGDEPFIDTARLEHRLCDVTEHYFNTGDLPGTLHTLLKRTIPRFKNKASYLPITRQRYQDDTDYINAIISAVQSMGFTTLAIQGPPGSGKTYTAEKVITQLIKQGCRVGIVSNSHAAIMNLLKPVSESSPDIAMAKVGGFGSDALFREQYPKEKYPMLVYRGDSFTQKQPYASFQVVGATVYAFVKEFAFENPLDYLFVDEASQVPLAALVAVAGATKNIVLMGDQKQLEQPIQGTHPDKSGASALEFMLENHAVIPEAQGIFLERTYRMHPDVCEPLSDVVYEGKLQADTDNSQQVITIPQPKLITKSNGILNISAHHEGRTQSSEEEVVIIQQLIDELKTGTFTDKKGQVNAVTDEDILIVAPYNMQVNLLKEKLNKNLRIGTIDKFQGQEAPVVIISMAVSDVAESPRGLDFVFDINRLNVAVSRAKAMTIIVANEGLEQCSVSSVKQMEKVGLFCRLKSSSN